MRALLLPHPAMKLRAGAGWAGQSQQQEHQPAMQQQPQKVLQVQQQRTESISEWGAVLVLHP